MFETFLVQPIYNAFIFLVGVMPGGDVGLAIIAMTVIMRIIFYPAFTAYIRTQIHMNAAQPELDEINKKYKDNMEERGRRTLQVYRERNIRPFSSILILLIQIPVFLALYFAFFREGLPAIATDILYSFVAAPEVVNTIFLGVLDIVKPYNLFLVAIVAGLQYLVAHISLARIGAPAATLAPERAAMHNMQRQMTLYFLPGLMAIVTYTLPAAAGIYFAATNVFSLGQELLIRRQLAAKKA
jgi:YidC/Oxa1 family membrane protein insertase